MSKISPNTSAAELAALVSQTLQGAGISATLSGGGAVSLYSENRYESADLDFVTSERNAVIEKALEPLGFRRVAGAREYEHPESPFYVEFPPGPLAFGETVIPDDEVTVFPTDYGPIRVITPTQCVMDRLAAYAHWSDRQALDQARLVAGHQIVDWSALYAWAEREGVEPGVIDKLKVQAEEA
jgi:hypothetical protein